MHVASPCKSVQHAHDVVAAGGEVRMLDPGSYGLLTITKSISILGDGHGGIATSNPVGAAITINAGASDVVNLRGLVLEGFGVGNTGIKIDAAKSVTIQDTIVRNFGTAGINSGPAATSVSGTIERVSVLNVGGGMQLSGKFTVTDSVVSNCAGSAITTSGTVMVRASVLSNCSGGGINANNGGTMRVTRSTITGNGTGFETFSGGVVISYGDNNVDGNTTNGSPTSTIGYH